jgi:hypothetical protein
MPKKAAKARRVCLVCGDPLPLDADRRQLYCTETHRRRAIDRRRRERARASGHAQGYDGATRAVDQVLYRVGAETARMLGMSRWTLDRIIERGEIRTVPLGGSRYISDAEIDRVLRGKQRKASA